MPRSAIGVPGVVVDVRMTPAAMHAIHALTAAALVRGDEVVTAAVGELLIALESDLFEMVGQAPVLLALTARAANVLAAAVAVVRDTTIPGRHVAARLRALPDDPLPALEVAS
jgi:hypothetical protein